MNFERLYLEGVRNLERWYDVVPGRGIVRDENSEYYGQYSSFQMIPDNNEIGMVKTAVCNYC